MSSGDLEQHGALREAIDAALRSVDGEVVARHHPRAPHRFGGRPPVAEVIVTRPPGHWHLVTVGLSATGSECSPDPLVSGWSFELTFRVVSDEEPFWAVELLTNLAVYLRSGGHGFAPGHHLDLRGPLRIGYDTELSAAVVVRDPGLGTLVGPFGELEAFQLLGLTADELEACFAHGTEAVVEVLARGNPLLVTDLDRSSATSGLRPPPKRSGPAELHVATLRWDAGRRGRVTVELGSATASALGSELRRVLSTAQGTLRVVGGDREVRFDVADDAGWELSGNALRVQVPVERLGDLAGMFTGRPGSYRDPAWPRLVWRVGV